MKPIINGDKQLDRTSLQELLHAAYVMQQHNERFHTSQSQLPENSCLWSSLWEPERKTENSAPEIVVESGTTGDAPDPFNAFPSALEDIDTRLPEPSLAEDPSKTLEEKPPPPSAEACPQWAQVYLDTALEAPNQPEPGPLPQLKTESAGTRAKATPSPAVPPRVVCVTCHRQNPRDRRFCGFCGSPLSHPKATVVSAAAVPIFGPDSRRAENQLQFLREKSLGSTYYHPGSRGRSTVAVAALARILANVTYVEWPSLHSRLQSVLHPSPVVQLPVASTRPTRPAPVTPAEAQQSGRDDNPEQGFSPPRSLPFAESASDKTNTAGRSTQHGQPPVSVSPSEPAGLAADGTEELLLANRYLDARGAAHNVGPAAALLWKAVSEQNTRADVLLADLYLLGDGVPKSCDQARLLLVAAAKKGSLKAAWKLRNIESSDCR
jgi:hypothetical protein